MEMTKDEIIRRYKEAKDKKDQIKILADLNLCSSKEIKDILVAAGVEIPKRPYVKKAEVITVDGQPQKAIYTMPAEKTTKKIKGGIPTAVKEAIKDKIKDIARINDSYRANIAEFEQAINENDDKIRVLTAYLQQEG